MKRNVKNEGNKLTKNNHEKKLAQELHRLRDTLAQSKKDEHQQTEIINKLEEKGKSLKQKTIDVDNQISELIRKAEGRGIKYENQE